LNCNKHAQTKKCSIIKDSNEEHTFIKELTKSLRSINTSDIGDITHLDSIVNEFASSLESIWAKNSKVDNIPRVGGTLIAVKTLIYIRPPRN